MRWSVWKRLPISTSTSTREGYSASQWADHMKAYIFLTQNMDVINCTLSEFSKLAQLIPVDELDRAKHILISSIYQNIERQSDRLE